MDKIKKPFFSLRNLIIIGLVLVLFVIAVFLLFLAVVNHTPRPEHHPFGVPFTDRSFVAEWTFGSRSATFYEQDGTRLHSPQSVEIWNSISPMPRVFFDADGIHLVAGSRATYPLHGDLDWAEHPVQQIIVVRECRASAAGVERGPHFSIERYTERNMVFVEPDALTFARDNDWQREYATTIPITDTQYQEIRRLLSEAPLAFRGLDGIDAPRYRIIVRTEHDRTMHGAEIFVEGCGIFEYLFFLKEAFG